MSDFDGYRDPPSRQLMAQYVASTRSMSISAAEKALRELNYVGLAYLYRDMTDAQSKDQVALSDYDPLEFGR